MAIYTALPLEADRPAKSFSALIMRPHIAPVYSISAQSGNARLSYC